MFPNPHAPHNPYPAQNNSVNAMGMNNPGMGAGMGNRAPLNRPNLMPNQPVRFFLIFTSFW